MFLHLGIVHILYFFYHYVWNAFLGDAVPIWVVIIVNIDIVVIDDLNYFGGIAFAQISKAHCLQLFLDIRVVLANKPIRWRLLQGTLPTIGTLCGIFLRISVVYILGCLPIGFLVIPLFNGLLFHFLL